MPWKSSSPGLVTGYTYVYDHLGVVQEDVTIYLRIVDRDTDVDGFIYDGATRSADSSGTGLVSFANMFPSVKYQMKRESGRKWYEFTMPASPSDPYELPSIIGED